MRLFGVPAPVVAHFAGSRDVPWMGCCTTSPVLALASPTAYDLATLPPQVRPPHRSLLGRLDPLLGYLARLGSGLEEACQADACEFGSDPPSVPLEGQDTAHHQAARAAAAALVARFVAEAFDLVDPAVQVDQAHCP